MCVCVCGCESVCGSGGSSVVLFAFLLLRTVFLRFIHAVDSISSSFFHITWFYHRLFIHSHVSGQFVNLCCSHNGASPKDAFMTPHVYIDLYRDRTHTCFFSGTNI